MDKKEYLKQAQHLEILIQCNQAELQQLKELSTCIKTVDYEKVSVMESGGNQQASFTKTVEKIVSLEEKIRDDLEKFVEVKEKIYESISSLESLEEKAVIRYRYVQGLSWYDISEKLNLSLVTLHRLHKKSLEKLKVDTL